MNLQFSLFISFLCVFSGIVSYTPAGAEDITDAEKLHTHLFENYNRNIRPIKNQTSTIFVGVEMYIRSFELDDVNEKLSFGAAFDVRWSDYKLRWNTADYNGLTWITVSRDKIWVPELLILSSANILGHNLGDNIGRPSDIIKINNLGDVIWVPSALIDSTCDINVKYYPFDTQTCNVSFISVGYKYFDVWLHHSFFQVRTKYYSENALWHLTDSSVSTEILDRYGEMVLMYTINLRRKPALVVVTIVLPILLLSYVNIFVFLLNPESGERIGFCITTLLAIVVYMTIVSDKLPNHPEPVPLISIKLFVDICLSALIVLCVIINHTFYFRDDEQEVTGFLQKMYRALTSLCRKRKIEPEISEKGNNKNAEPISQPDSDEQQQYESVLARSKRNGNEIKINFNDETPITWKKISFMIDWLALIIFCFAETLNWLVYIIVAKVNNAL